MRLGALQGAFRDRVLGGPDAVADALAAPPGVDPQARMDIYVRAYRARLYEALASTFEKTAAYLGEDGFEAACDGFVAASRSHSWTLRDYGRGFPEHLDTAWPDDPEVGELARLDWTLRRAFDGPDSEPIAPEAYAALDEAAWSRVVFRLHPTLAVLKIRTNVADIWRALNADEAPPAPAALDRTVSLRIWRRDLRPHFRTIGDAEARALAWTEEGLGFAEICDRLAREEAPDAATSVASDILQSWIADELIVGLD
jgi:hypothetical protein